MYNGYLAHHGIKGQKWGIRRFQAYGSGGYDRKGGETGQVVGEAKKKASWNVNPDNVSKAAKQTANIANNTTNIARSANTIHRNKFISNMDVSNMSDKELRDAINRMNLERSYKSLKYEDVAEGRENVQYILSIIGSTVAIGASAAAMASAIYSMKK